MNSSSAFNARQEIGFSENINGAFEQLSVIKEGHTLAFPTPIPVDMKGFLHSHLNGYEITDTNNDGIPDRVEPIKMFSPADIIAFLELLKNAKANNIPVIDVYGSMYSSVGDYTLRFSGDINDVLRKIDRLKNSYQDKSLNATYKNYFERFGNKEKAFLKFMENEIGISGIRLYQLNHYGLKCHRFLNLTKVSST